MPSLELLLYSCYSSGEFLQRIASADNRSTMQTCTLESESEIEKVVKTNENNKKVHMEEERKPNEKASIQSEHSGNYQAECLGAKQGKCENISAEKAAKQHLSRVEVIPASSEVSESVPSQETDENGWNALHWAVWNRDADKVEAMMRSTHVTQLLNQQTTQDVTIATESFQNKKDGPKADSCPEIFHGNYKDADERIDFLAVEENKEIAKNDENRCSLKQVTIARNSSPLHIAVIARNSQAIDKLAGKQKMVDWKLEDNSAYTALNLAAKYDQVHILKQLINVGMDINLKNSNGDAAIHTAILHGSNDVLMYLLNNESTNIAARNRLSKLPLHLAIQTTNSQVLQLILKRQNRFIAPTYEKVLNPLKVAILHSNDEAMEILLNAYDSSSFLHATERNEEPLLHLASKLGLSSMVKILLTNGANISTATKKKMRGSRNKSTNEIEKTALDVATEKGLLHIAVMLMSAGAKQSKDNSLAMSAGLIAHNLQDVAQTQQYLCELLQFGYKFQLTAYKPQSLNNQSDKDAKYNSITQHDVCEKRDQIMSLVQNLGKEPLRLSRIAGNTILRNLRPNAWRSVEKLPLPAVIKLFITHNY